MEVYRISLTKWTKKLTASGYPARWNSKGKFIIYTASSRALACLENVVHRSGEGLHAQFKVMLIQIPKSVRIEEIKLKDLPQKWSAFENFRITQEIGDDWLERNTTAVLRIPSSLVKMEYNYLINPNHPDFTTIRLSGTEDFEFDPRIKKA